MKSRCTIVAALSGVAATLAMGIGQAIAQEPVPCQILGLDGPQWHGTYVLNLWPNGVIPYEFNANVIQANRDAMAVAMNKWDAVAEVTFRPRVGEDANWVHIQDAGGNSSYVGMIGGSQAINIYNWNYTYIMAHELGHALGLLHEQSRPDRDQYVSINAANIQAGYGGNFNITGNAYGPYDFDSVMHYDGCSFSTCCSAGSTCSCSAPCQTITVLPPYQDQQINIGQRTHLSVGDANSMRWLYPGCGWMPGRWGDEAKRIAADTAAEDYFGGAVAISGNTAVVGALGDDRGTETYAGSAYVFAKSGGVWTQQAKLNTTDPAADRFGNSVSTSGDTAVVGSIGNGSFHGAAYVFVRSGGFWAQQQKLTASDAAANDYFGVSVATSGDTTVVGAHLDNNAGGSHAGSAYVFVRTGGVWVQQAKLTTSDAAANDYFGWSVAVSGDTVVAGAWGDTHSGVSFAGSAYIFVRSGSTWTQRAKLSASDAAFDDEFGKSVAMSGDTIVVGADYDSQAGLTQAGAAYVFVKPDVGWSNMTQTAKLSAFDAASGDNFGQSVALFGNTLAIGAAGDDDTGLASGSAYIFNRVGTVWTQQAKLTASDAAASDNFAESVAVSEDTAIVGAFLDDNAVGVDAGSVYIYSRLPICPGDIDGNGQVQYADVQTLVQAVMSAIGTPQQLQAADMNCDGVADGADLHLFVNKLVSGGACS